MKLVKELIILFYIRLTVIFNVVYGGLHGNCLKTSLDGSNFKHVYILKRNIFPINMSSGLLKKIKIKIMQLLCV